ncbi:MAG TPA: cytochrome b/b6 domain-containing protein [Thermoanaerobaculaceae bacterium]|nr:cytochrome b/b6 domain-containing protein [Thermoanaerobaculaceae bacterium]HRS15095.1 cytochrome b/b6 domain-containing protein [Thermoanaerobaculaceae bacterium]
MSRPRERIRFYTPYERLWHWVQAVAVVVLVATGFALAFPARIGTDVFRAAVQAHNLFAAVLLVNAFLALFYNLASNLIRRYVPTADDLLSQGVRHARYYMFGIFRGEPHPFDRTPEKRLMPLQKVTYFAILNVLLPGMAVTGGWRYLADAGMVAAPGGLATLAVLHRFGAWLFAAFLLLHIYMTTTGPTLLANLKAMLTGWGEGEHGKERVP